MKRITCVLFVLLLAQTSTFGRDESFESTLEKARGGDRDAQNEVGIMYSEGQGVKPSQKKAVFWFRKSGEQGYSIGICNLGLHCAYGWGVPKNRTLMMKWVFAAHLINGLKCNPADYIKNFKPTECQIEKGWELALTWLREHADFKNIFNERPWMESEDKYPVTVREYGGSFKLPVKSSQRCR